jgi:carboxyl-terminal processing protease
MCVLVGAACASMPAAKTPAASEPVSSALAMSTFDTLWTVVRNTYVDTAFVRSHWTALRDTLRPQASLVENRRDLNDLLATTLKRIPDSHFYIIPEHVAESDDKADTLGVGGTIGLDVRAIGEKAVAWKVEPGSPAAASGITPGETIVRIGDVDPSKSLRMISSVPEAGRPRALLEALHGFNHATSPSPGTTVHVRVADGAGRISDHAVVAVPAKGTVSQFGNLPPLAGRVLAQKVGGSNAPCVGVIGFNIWLPALVPEIEKGMDGITSCAGIVVDLRGNPGGVGAMVMGFGGYFVDSVISLGTMRSRQVSLRFVMNPRHVRNDGSSVTPYGGPVAILVDPMTASTSEIFAAGMQRIGRARVFGERSAGAALPAMMDRLPSGDVFVHAVADFTDPDGKRIEGAGVVPDEITPLSVKDLANGRDTALEAAVRWIRSNPATQKAPVSQTGSVHSNFN